MPDLTVVWGASIKHSKLADARPLLVTSGKKPCTEYIGEIARECAMVGGEISKFIYWISHVSRQHIRAQRRQLIGDGRHHTKVPASPFQRPQQLGIFLFTDIDKRTVSDG